MSEALSRIKQFIDSQGIKVSAFERSIGISNGSFASQLKNGKTIGVDKIENILRKYPELNETWVLRGEGSMLKQVPFDKKQVPFDKFFLNEQQTQYITFNPSNEVEAESETVNILKLKLEHAESTIQALQQTIELQKKMIEFLTK